MAALTVGMDEAGYGPKLGPLVVAAAWARGPLPDSVRIADSKKIFSPARGAGALEPAVLGFLPARSFEELLERLGARRPAAPWYRLPLPLGPRPALAGLEGAAAVILEAAEYNAALDGRSKADVLFDAAEELFLRALATGARPIRFLVGKHGGRRYYLSRLRRAVAPEAVAREETPGRSVYEAPGVTIEFLKDAEDCHELVALASMIAKYVRECAMKLFNDWWSAQCPGLRRTAGYGTDGTRFFRQIEPLLPGLGLPADGVLRRR
ncbi:MAG: hypothetical protein ACK44W_11970 [Planctomycetota bacterium]